MFHRGPICMGWGVVAALATVTAPGAAAPAGGAADHTSLRGLHTAHGLLNRGLYELAADEYRAFLERRPDDAQGPAARYGLAVCLFRTGQHPEAVRELGTLAELDRFECAAEVSAMLGRSLIDTGRYPEAAAAFDRVIREHPDHQLADDAAAGAVEAYYQVGNYDDAIRRARALLSGKPKPALRDRSLYYLSASELANGDLPTAVADLERLIAGRPDPALNSRARLMLAQALEAMDRPADAALHYRALIKRNDPACADPARMGLAGILYGRQEWEQAIGLLDRVLRGAPGGGLAGAAGILRGRIRLEQKRFDDAEAALEAARKADPSCAAEAAYWTARCELGRGGFVRAAEALASLIERYPDSALLAEACYDRAVALMKAGNDAAAGAALIAFRERFSGRALAADALRHLALLSHRRRDYAQSRAYCQEYLRKHPTGAGVAEVRFLAAENAYLADRLPEATEGFRKFLAQYPSHAQAAAARFRLGMAAYRSKQWHEAAALLEELDLDRDVPVAFRPALLALGEIHFQRGEWADAERFLETYVGGKPEVASADDALLKLGLSRQRQGKHRTALEVYERLLADGRKSRHRSRALYEHGQTLLSLGERRRAVEAFDDVVREDGESEFAAYAVYQLGSLSMQAQDFEAAVGHFERAAERLTPLELRCEAAYQGGQGLMALERYADAERVFRGLLAQCAEHGRVAPARARLVTALAGQGKLTEAVSQARELEASGLAALAPAARAGVLYESAQALGELGDTEAAVTVYRRLIEEHAEVPELSARAALALAAIYANRENHGAAAAVLEAVAGLTGELPPEIAERWAFRRAMTEFERGRWESAARMLEGFLDAFPASPLRASAGLHCGEAHLRSGRPGAAIGRLERVAEAFPDDPVCGPVLLRLGEALAALQRWARSERALADYVRRFPDSEQRRQAEFGIGWARENQQRYEEAVEAYRPVAEHQRGALGARAQFQIGECLFALRRHAEATRALLKVDILYASPQWSAAALYEAGRCLEAQNQRTEARMQFEAVTSRYPESKWSALARERLAVADDPLPGRE